MRAGSNGGDQSCSDLEQLVLDQSKVGSNQACNLSRFLCSLRFTFTALIEDPPMTGIMQSLLPLSGGMSPLIPVPSDGTNIEKVWFSNVSQSSFSSRGMCWESASDSLKHSHVTKQATCMAFPPCRGFPGKHAACSPQLFQQIHDHELKEQSL